MRRVPAGLLLTFGLVAGLHTGNGARAQGPRRAVLITLDGVRTEEMFGGLDRIALTSTVEKGGIEGTRAYKDYWADTPEARRQKVMPFLWDTLLRDHGSIAGNRARGSQFGVTNHMRFSYPGYSEILTGAAHDEVIDSNDNKRYPFLTVLEFLRGRFAVPPDQVAVFGSWETFHWIAEHEDGALTVNAGYETFSSPDPAVDALSRAQFEATTPWESARHDAYTFRFAMDHLRRRQAARDLHRARRDRRLGARAELRLDCSTPCTARTATSRSSGPGCSPTLTTGTTPFCSSPRTTGAGTAPKDWSDHGKDVVGANETWLIAAGPDWPRRGEWTNAPPAFTNQIASTLARSLGEDFRAAVPGAGAPIDYLWQHP